MFARYVSDKVKTVFFMALAVMMYASLEKNLELAVYIKYKHVFALLIIAAGFLCFLFRPEIGRFVISVKDAFAYSLPLWVMTTISLLIWLINRSDPQAIMRGISYYYVFTNMFSAALAAGVLLYLFGKNGIWFNLVAILIVNCHRLITLMLEYGVGPFFREMFLLVSTFAGQSGDIMSRAEIHELAFCLGAYLVYMILRPEKSKASFWLLLGATAFCFLAAFKRIAIVAIGICLVTGFFLKLVRKKHPQTVSTFINVLTFLLILLLIAYIAVIKADVFTMMDRAGLETNGRDVFYSAVNDLYSFSPAYLGGGMGYLPYYLNSAISLTVRAVHNDFLQFYVDLGFFGYIIWLISMTYSRTGYFGKRSNVDDMISTFCVSLFLIICSATDNTINFSLLATVTAILMMGPSYEARAQAHEQKRFAKLLNYER